MKHFKKVVPRNFNYFLFGDLHFGTRFQYVDGIELLKDMIMSPYKDVKHNIGMDHGDVVEAIMVDDPRFHPSTVTNPPMAQLEEYQKVMTPVKKKLVCILDGMHPRKLWKSFGSEGGTGQLCKMMNVPYGTWTAVISFYDRQGRFLFKHFGTHGKKAMNSSADDPVRRETTIKLALKKILKQRYGDTLLMSRGHTHRLVYLEPLPELYICDERDRILVPKHTGPKKVSGYIHPDYRWYVSSGGFHMMYLEGYDSYAELAEYDPLELGFCIVRVRDGKLDGIDRIVLGV